MMSWVCAGQVLSLQSSLSILQALLIQHLCGTGFQEREGPHNRVGAALLQLVCYLSAGMYAALPPLLHVKIW